MSYLKKTLFFIVLGLIWPIAFILAGNPGAPIQPSDNIQDPGSPSTPWGGCGPSDSNCYVTVSGSSQDLQSVTDAGNVTTNEILAGSLSVSVGGTRFIQAYESGGHGAIDFRSAGGGIGIVQPSSFAGFRFYTLPNASGTVALQEWVEGKGGSYTDGLFHVDSSLGTASLGDHGSDVNGTYVKIDDAAKTITGTLDGIFNIRGGNYPLSGMIYADTDVGYVVIGDGNGEVNGTFLQVDDMNQVFAINSLRTQIDAFRSGATINGMVLDINNHGTFNTTSGNLISYGGYFNTDTTRSAGSNTLTNIGLYATASGAQNNYAAIFDQGNVGIGTITPGSKLEVNGLITASGINVPEGKKIYVDSVNGNDSTGARGTTKAFLTITAAKDAAQAGDLIVVRPGTYDEYDLLKNSVHYYFENGARIVYSGSPAPGVTAIFFSPPGSGIIDISVKGEGYFEWAAGGSGYIAYLEEDNTVAYFSAIKMVSNGSDVVGADNASNLSAYFDVTEVSSAGDTFYSAILSGIMQMNVDYVSSGASVIVAEGTANLNFRAKRVEASRLGVTTAGTIDIQVDSAVLSHATKGYSHEGGTTNIHESTITMSNANATVIDAFAQGLSVNNSRLNAGSSATYSITTSGATIVATSYFSSNKPIDPTLTNQGLIDIAGNFGINDPTPDYVLDVEKTSIDGNIFALHDSDGECLHNPEAGSEVVSCSSDERLKRNIVDTTSALSYFSGFHIRDYDVAASGDHMTGIIAQEVLLSHPELVSQHSNGLYSVELPNQWKVIKAIQELDLKVNGIQNLADTGDESFVHRLRIWLADTLNGIEDFVVGRLRARNQVCVGETCIDEGQLKALIQNASPMPQTPPQQPPISDPTPPVTSPEDTNNNADGSTENNPDNQGTSQPDQNAPTDTANNSETTPSQPVPTDPLVAPAQ